VRARLAPTPEIAIAAAAAFATLFASLWIGRIGTEVGLASLAAPIAFAALIVGFVRVPHIIAAAIVPLFVVTPAAKLFVDPRIGGAKEVLTAAAIVASIFVIVQRRARNQDAVRDDVVFILLLAVVAMYLVNVGGHVSGATGYDVAWFHSMRLRAPLVLFLAGLILPNPRRTLRALAISTIVTACALAAYGLFQQALGPERLVQLGYEWNSDVRTIGGHLRSFGTLDTPFSYASLLVFALVFTLFWPLSRRAQLFSTGLITLGLAAAFVRTTAAILIALAGIWLVRRGHRAAAFLALATFVVATAVLIASLNDRTSRSVQFSPGQYVTLNGRTTVWQERLGSAPMTWLLGRGVGSEGAAATRAERSFDPAQATQQRGAGGGSVVDSAYFVTMTDVGLVGLIVVCVLFATVIARARSALDAEDPTGWLVLSGVAVVAISAVTQEVLTDFPFAYISLFTLGVAIAAISEGGRRRSAPRGRIRSA
jgi:hypothetical protein